MTPSYLLESNASIAEGESYPFRGKDYSQPGIYDDSLKTVNGCDSIYRLHLSFGQTYLFKETTTICEGKTFDFRGQILTQPGIYYDSLKTTTSCDSVYQLKLSVNQSYLFTRDTSICAWETYPFKGSPLTQSGIYDDSLATVTGCDSIYRLQLHIRPTNVFPESATICQGGTYEFKGEIYSQSGIYYDTLKNDASCSVYQLDLKVIEPTPHRD